MSWDVTLDVGSLKSVDRSENIMLEEGGWTLTKAIWEPDTEGIIWADHTECKNKTLLDSRYCYQKFGTWFPRDNALAGKCCYCGAEVPEHFITLFKMYNWELVSDWEHSMRTNW